MKNISCEIGKNIPRFDAYEKVTGKTRYAVDFYKDGMLWVGVKRGNVPCGKLLSVDIEKALKVEGVKKILLAKDVSGSNAQGVVQKDQEVLATDFITHRGSPVALVISENRYSLEKAIDAIELEIKEIQPLLSIEDSLKTNAPIIHKTHKEGNVLLKGELKKGEIDKGFSESDVVIDAEFQLPMQEHAYLETETGWAIFTKDRILEITVSTQTPFRDRAEVAEALGLEVNKVRIIAPYCGGAFGGKDGITVQTFLGLAAMNFPEIPVKIWYEREESFIVGVKRHPAKIYFKIGAKSDGTLNALYADIKYDTGPHDHLGGVVMALGLEHAGGPYKIPNTKLKGVVAYTNNPIGGAFRGFGVPQVASGIEQVMDMLSEKLNLSPVEIRKKNILKRGDKNAINVSMLTSIGVDECLEILEKHDFWINRENWKKEAPLNKKRGVGIACAIHGIGYGPKVPDIANAKIELTEDGSFKVYCGVVDMGQGNISTYLQIAGNILNQHISAMEPVLPDTDKTLPSGSSSASRTTFTFGNALIKASNILKEKIIEKCADLLMEENIKNFDLIPGKVIHLPSGKEISLKQIAMFFSNSERYVTSRYRVPISREEPTKDELLKLHGIPHYIFSFGAHLAGVEVDILTGSVSVKRYLVVSDCGRMINPQIFQQQVHGGVAQGIGYGLYENMIAKQGKILTQDFSTYILPTSLDIPDMQSITVDRDEKYGPYGLKGAGEVAIDAPLPAIANAVYDACGVRVNQFPISSEKIIEKLECRI